MKPFYLKCLNVFLLVFAVVLVAIGISFIAMYLWEGVIARIGEPDQSLLFWYLPVLFIGIFSLVSGVTLFLRAKRKLKH